MQTLLITQRSLEDKNNNINIYEAQIRRPRFHQGENGFVTQPTQCRRELAIAIFDLDFADDLALLEGNLERAQSQLNKTAKQAEQVGLMVNVKKTEAFTNQDKSKNLKLDSQRIEWVNNFKYLGSMVKSSETDINSRKA
ncbi:uncharacterized protein LOC103374843 [Tachysurus ichikawai]